MCQAKVKSIFIFLFFLCSLTSFFGQQINQGKNYVERKTIGQLKLIELNGNFMRMKIIDGKKEILQCLSNPDKNKNLLLKIKK